MRERQVERENEGEREREKDRVRERMRNGKYIFKNFVSQLFLNRK